MIVRHGAVRRRSGFPYEMPTAPPWNAPTFCEVPTYDKTGAFVHFSVLDMHNEVGKDWHGWRYWAALTPYYRGNDDVENPSIVVSSDGFHWVVPTGVQNPIYPEPTLGLNMWNADTDIAYDPKSDALVLTFQGEREGVTTQDQVFAISTNGTDWPMRAGTGGMENIYRRSASACLVNAGSTWLLYAVDTGGSGATGIRKLRCWESTNPHGPWVTQREQTIASFPWGGMWHIEVLIDSDGLYRMLVWTGWDRQYIYPCTSANGQAWAVGEPIMRAAQHEPTLAALGRWDHVELYRGSFTEHGPDHFRVWYAGNSVATDWRLGCVDVPKSAWPAAP